MKVLRLLLICLVCLSYSAAHSQALNNSIWKRPSNTLIFENDTLTINNALGFLYYKTPFKDNAQNGPCPSADTAIYRYKIIGDTLILAKISDTCPGRIIVFD